MNRFTRRDFLETSLAAATAALCAPGLHREAHAAESAAPAKPVGPNDKIMLAVIGMHGRGSDHINGYLAQPDVTIAALCDVDSGVAEKAAKHIEEKTGRRPRIYQDLRKLYDDPEIHAVSMALPIHWHSLAAIWAMQAGKDVYVEKPVCHNLFEGRQLVNAAKRYGRICQGGTQSRSNAAVRDAVAYLHAGKAGKVHLARGLCYKPRNSIGILPDGPVPAGVDYNIWLGPAPERPFNPNRFHYNWHWNWDYGMGDLGNQGIHQMDIARWALGKDGLPSRVMGMGGRFGYVDQGETPNTAVAVYDYGDAHLIFEVRGLKTPVFQGVTKDSLISIGDLVYGTDGFVAFTDNYGKAAAFDNDTKLITEFKGGGDHFRNYLDAVRSRKTEDLHAPVRETYLSSALCHLGNISYRLGHNAAFKDEPSRNTEAKETFDRMRSHLADNGIDVNATPYRLGPSLQFDSHRERFKGDRHEDADAFLTRAYREPFVVPKRL